LFSWASCVWEGTAEVGDEMTMETYLRLGHLVYSAAELDQPELDQP
jgi:hypothetical protein